MTTVKDTMAKLKGYEFLPECSASRNIKDWGDTPRKPNSHLIGIKGWKWNIHNFEVREYFLRMRKNPK
jgi:hypothetical protein